MKENLNFFACKVIRYPKAAVQVATVLLPPLPSFPASPHQQTRLIPRGAGCSRYYCLRVGIKGNVPTLVQCMDDENCFSRVDEWTGTGEVLVDREIYVEWVEHSKGGR